MWDWVLDECISSNTGVSSNRNELLILGGTFGGSSLKNMQIFSLVCFCISLMMLPSVPRTQPKFFEGTKILEQMALSRFSLSLVLALVFPCNWRNASNVGETPSLATTYHYFVLQVNTIHVNIQFTDYTPFRAFKKPHKQQNIKSKNMIFVHFQHNTNAYA